MHRMDRRNIPLPAFDRDVTEELRLLRDLRARVGSWPWGVNGESIDREAIDFRPVAELLKKLDPHRGVS